MSIHHRTPPGFLRWGPTLVVALGLSALVWSCESEQTGYEVTLPLLGPMEFDEKSCEISDDVCETDDDCVDEDGFFVGPCTKTMEEIQPITIPVSLSAGNPSYSLGSVDTAPWTTILTAQQIAAEAGMLENIELDMTMDDFSIQGGPITISVRVFSRVGLIAGRPTTYEPVTPSSCTFTLDDSSTGSDYADGINTCLNDWISENGAPVEFDMEVTSSAGAAASAFAAKSGFGRKQTDYNLDGTYELRTSEQCETEFIEDVLEPIREGDQFFKLISCDGLTLTGNGRTDQKLDVIGGYGLVWDRCGNWAVAGILKAPLEAGTYEVRVLKSGEVEQDDVVPVLFFPAGVDFAKALVGAATGACFDDGPLTFPILAEGAAYAGWHHCGPTPPPDRTGEINVTTGGVCTVTGGSKDAGTGQDSGL